jgi:hypothetical protein
VGDAADDAFEYMERMYGLEWDRPEKFRTYRRSSPNDDFGNDLSGQDEGNPWRNMTAKELRMMPDDILVLIIHLINEALDLEQNKMEGEEVKKIVQISFAGNKEVLYDFFCDMRLRIGDPVVCDTARGFSIGRVEGFVEESDKAEKWIVQKVDIKGHQERLRREAEKEMEDLLS